MQRMPLPERPYLLDIVRSSRVASSTNTSIFGSGTSSAMRFIYNALDSSFRSEARELLEKNVRSAGLRVRIRDVAKLQIPVENFVDQGLFDAQ